MKDSFKTFPHQEETEPLPFWKQRVLRWKLDIQRELREEVKAFLRVKKRSGFQEGVIFKNQEILDETREEILGKP